MNTYIIGDVQGCYDSLMALLDAVKFNPEEDRLGFVGDLVNCGPKSLETLRFIKQLKDPIVVLGNHDLRLLATAFCLNATQDPMSDTLTEILHAPDYGELIHWLLKQSLMYWDKVQNFVLIHAGIPPIWSIEVTYQYAENVMQMMRANPVQFFENIYGNEPVLFREDLSKWDQVKYILNALTRMRFCNQNGHLDLKNKTDFSIDPEYRPWFHWIDPIMDLFFGHWASLDSAQCRHPKIHALDTGCVWAGELSAKRVEDKQAFSIHAQEDIYAF
ncbi:MAG: diadenosine tetraphosphatase [uncultured bacterium]|nr:MAG: diadenosine tetraphosphatase [uncultured bacterium]OGT46931.1 MAG: bis(5'-nucleosyl)-tetraphosphatase (symmetrical) [Gammaproteobacteria bacterium RIFCSPHIGHO2_12_FULL_38_11]